MIVSPALRAKAPPFFYPSLIDLYRRFEGLYLVERIYNRQRIRGTSLYPFSVALIELRVHMFRNACNGENGVSPDS